jgi:hypothetical protein
MIIPLTISEKSLQTSKLHLGELKTLFQGIMFI